ncbi:hypothetical protein HMPREF0043_02367 [Actinobaculum sp. oral taxon 183 str. F0552]|nr:hypothetical protein HMPREF0043_02367 [Actinobaculum sp. oral taxon 183 str. F0552]
MSGIPRFRGIPGTAPRRRLGGAEFGPRSPRPALRRPREREYSRSEASGDEAIRRSSR